VWLSIVWLLNCWVDDWLRMLFLMDLVAALCGCCIFVVLLVGLLIVAFRIVVVPDCWLLHCVVLDCAVLRCVVEHCVVAALMG